MKSRFADKSVSLIVTSPPYNLGIDYGTEEYNDRMPRQKYLDWMLDISCEMHRVLSDRGSLFLNLGSKPTDPYVPHDVLDIFRRSWHLQNTFLWVKSLYVPQIGKTFGHFKPYNSPRFVNPCWEFVFHLTKTGEVPVDRLALGVPYEDASNKKRWNNPKGIRCRGNTWMLDTSDTCREESIWLAAMVDGEGSILINRNDYTVEKLGHSPNYAARVEVNNTSRVLLERVAEIAGCGQIHDRPPRDESNSKKICYTWVAASKEARTVIERIYPHLIAKQDQARLVLYLESSKVTTGYRQRLTCEALQTRERLWEEVKQLNQGEDVDTSWVPSPILTYDTDVWHVPYKTIQSRDKDRGGHPATFPPQLAMNCMLAHGVDRIKLALDPFVGEGNSAVAASRLGVNFVGFELVEQTYNNAVDKLRKAKEEVA